MKRISPQTILILSSNSNSTLHVLDLCARGAAAKGKTGKTGVLPIPDVPILKQNLLPSKAFYYFWSYHTKSHGDAPCDSASAVAEMSRRTVLSSAYILSSAA